MRWENCFSTATTCVVWSWRLKGCFSFCLGRTTHVLCAASKIVMAMLYWLASKRAKYPSMAATARVIRVVRMRTAMAIPGNWYVCFSIYFALAYFWLNTDVCYRWHFHTHAVWQLFFNSYHMCSVELALKWVLFHPPQQSKARRIISKWDRGDYTMLISLHKSETSHLSMAATARVIFQMTQRSFETLLDYRTEYL